MPFFIKPEIIKEKNYETVLKIFKLLRAQSFLYYSLKQLNKNAIQHGGKCVFPRPLGKTFLSSHK